jgi:RHS repeat-associated protein
VAGPVRELFRPTERGIEQTFSVPRRPSGSGSLVIPVPVSGLTATTTSSGAVDLCGPSGLVRATYSALAVTDAAGRHVGAHMEVAGNGSVIDIVVADAGARYPLRVDPTWSEVAELTAAGPADDLGWDVSVSGTTAVASSPSSDVAYVFDLANGSWAQARALDVPGGGVTGTALAGTTVVLADGDQSVDGNAGQGAAYVFDLSSGSGSAPTELTAGDGAAGDDFGGWGAVAISGSTVVVGAPGHDDGEGAAYVYDLSAGSDAVPSELSAPDAAPGAGFGTSVAVSGPAVAVGARANASQAGQGTVYAFEHDGSSGWSPDGELYGPNLDDGFGGSVALSGSKMVVGAPLETVDGNPDQGAAYVFSAVPGGWSAPSDLYAANGATGDELGWSVALSATTAVAGAPHHAVGSSGDEGETYLFTPDGSTWEQSAGVTAPDGGADDWFGQSVSLSGANLLVGSPQSGSGFWHGAAYVFSSDVVQPQGSAPGADLWGGRSKSIAACPCLTDRPVDLATGDLTDTFTDVAVPGAGVPLSFSRTYDAQAAQAEVTAGTPPPPLGYGWADDFGMSVAYSPGAQTATVTEEGGSQLSFAPYVAGSSPAWCSSATDFCPSDPRVEATLNQGPDGTWSFVRTTGATETFDFSSAGALTSVTDAQGDTLSAQAYAPTGSQAPCPGGDACTAWASSASGRELVLATDTAGQLVSVFDADSTLAASFSYSGTGCSTWAGSEAPDLCSATDPGDLTSSYTYGSGDPTPSSDYDLVSDTLPGDSAPTVNVYNSSGEVAEQTDPSGAVTTFSYSGTNATLLGGTTTVTDYPDGTGTGAPADQSVYQFSNNVLVGDTTGVGTGAAQAQSLSVDPVSLLPLASTDGDGNTTTATYQTYSGPAGTDLSSANVLTSTDAMGNTTEHAYNAFNQAWCTVDASDYANGVTCPAAPPAAPPAPGSPDPWAGAALGFYSPSGQLLASTDALGNTTTFSYTSGVPGVPDGLRYCSVGPVSYQAGVTCPAYAGAHVPGTTTSTFDAAGDEISSTNPDGATTTYVFGTPGLPGLVSSETAPDGATTSFTYNAAGQVTRQVELFGAYSATTLYAYDSYGRQFCEVAPAEAAKGATCPAAPPSTPPAPGDDPYLGATVTTYDADGRAVQVTNPLGGVTYTAYEQAGEAFCSVAPAEAASGATCPASAPATLPTPGADPYLGATITTYDASGRVVQVTNPRGGTTQSEYDAAGDLTGTVTESDDPTADPDVVTAYTYDADNRVVSTTVDPGGGALASTSLSSYDPDGNVYCSVSADAYASGSYQCPAWQPGWASSPPPVGSLYSSAPSPAQAEAVTASFYDADGDLVQRTTPDQGTSVSVYDGDGDVTCTEDAADMMETLAARPPVLSADVVHLGAAGLARYPRAEDAADVMAVASSGYSPYYPYGCPGRPGTAPPAPGSDPGYESTVYDPAGLVQSSTDAAGDTTAYTYDADGQVLTTTGPGGQVTTNCYYWETTTCAAGAPAGGGDADDLYSTTSPPAQGEPAGAVTTYTYAPGGALATKTTAAGTAADTYDAAGDVTSVAYGPPAPGYRAVPGLAYTYNVDGTVATMTDGTGETTYGYDAAGDLTSAAFVAKAGTGLASGTTSYSYYSSGDRETLVYPVAPAGGSPTVTYTYDAAGGLASVSDWSGRTTDFTNDPDGGTTSVAYPNDATVSTAYDLGDATTSVQVSEGSPGALGAGLLGAGYQRDAAERVTSESDTGALGASPTYGYDSASRLGSVTEGAAGAAAEAYDPSGDPVTLADGTTQAFDAAGQLTGATGTGGSTATYGYDATGDRTSASTSGNGTTTTTVPAATTTTAPGATTTGPSTSTVTTSTTAPAATTTTVPAATTTSSSTTKTGPGGTTASYTYDEAGRLVGASTPSGATVSYAYDGASLLAGRTTSAGTATCTWDGTSDLPLLLSDGTNDYLYGPDGTPVEQASLSTGTPDYFVPDGQGSTRALLAASGSVDATFTYDPYGDLTASTGTATTPLLYGSQYLDTVTGFYYLRARWYDPATDQFTSVDPDVAQTGEPYAYAGDDPVNGWDPSGLCDKNTNGSLWEAWNPFSTDNPIYCAGIKHPNGGVTNFIKEADPMYGVIAGYSSCRDSHYSMYTCANLNFNPMAQALESYSSCRDSSGSAYNCVVSTADPMYWALNGYAKEVSAARSGCDFLTTLGYGAQGVEGLWAAETLAYGVASSAGAETAATAPRVVIGGMEDLGPGSIGPGEETLASRLPGDTGDRLGNWLNNREVLQQAMDEGNPIRDASVDSEGNLRLEDTRRFITMERDYLRSAGWTYDPSTTLWMPPG